MTKCTAAENITISYSAEIWLTDETIKYICNTENIIKHLLDWLTMKENHWSENEWIEKTIDVNWNEIKWIAFLWWDVNLIFSIKEIKESIINTINQPN